MSFTTLRFHIILTVKHRQNLITREVEDFLYPYLSWEIDRCGGGLLKINGVENHVHIANWLKPTIDISGFLRKIKSRSTGALRREFPHLAHFSWTKGFSAFTVSAFEIDHLVTYIERQKVHHAAKTTQPELETIFDGTTSIILE